MSNIQPLKTIKSPSLSDANFGERVNDTFNDINDNFTKLSSYDYIKGEEGRGLWLQAYNLINDVSAGSLLTNSISDAIISTIVNATPTETELDKAALYIMYAKGFLNGEGAGTIYLIYDSQLEGVDTASDDWKRGGWMDGLVGCIPWTYLDPRFSAETISITETIGQTDMSGVLTWQANDTADGGYFNISHPFPTLYYNTDAGRFCWVVNGNKTGLPAQGPSGKDGTPGNIIVCCTDASYSAGVSEITGQTGTFVINSYLVGATGGAVSENENWIELQGSIPSWEGATAIVYWGDPQTGVDNQRYWITTIRMINTVIPSEPSEQKDRMVVYLSNANKIDTILTPESIYTVFSQMFSNGMNGFLIPFKDANKAHVFTADSIYQNDDGTARGVNDQLLIVPASSGASAEDIDGIRNKISITGTKDGITYTLTGYDSGLGEWVWTGPDESSITTRSIHGGPEELDSISITYNGPERPAAHAVIGYDVAVLGDLYVNGISGARITEKDIDQMFDKIF